MYFLCLRYPLRPREEWKVTLLEHLEWMKGLHENGTVIMSGPSRDRSVSLYVIKTDSLESAEQIAAGDPFTAGGECRFELIEWDVHQILGIGSFVDT